MQDASALQETIVYGYIRAIAEGPSELDRQRRHANLCALAALPAADSGELVHSGMFGDQCGADVAAVQVIHFAQCRAGLEYQWDSWIEQFEALLRRLCWSRVTVQLETAALGTHTFHWVASVGGYCPGRTAFDDGVQRLWQRSGVVY